MKAVPGKGKEAVFFSWDSTVEVKERRFGERVRAFGAYKAEMILFCPKSVAIWNGSIHFLTVS